MSEVIWCHKDKKHHYYQVESDNGKFQLCQCNGSLASIKTYKDKEEALKEGWYIFKGVL